MRVFLPLVLPLLAAVVAAEDKVTLKARYDVGAAYTVERTLKSNMTGKVQGQDFSGTHDQSLQYAEKVVGAEDGRPSKVERTYRAYRRVEKASIGGAPLPGKEFEGDGLVGEKLTLVDDGEDVYAAGGPAAAAHLEDDDLALGLLADHLLPAAPVAAGETWKVSDEALCRLYQTEKVSDVAATGKLVEVVEGRAHVEFDLSFKALEDGGSQTVKIRGPAVFDLEAGRFRSVKLEGNVTFEIAGAGTVSGPVSLSETIASN